MLVLVSPRRHTEFLVLLLDLYQRLTLVNRVLPLLVNVLRAVAHYFWRYVICEPGVIAAPWFVWPA